MKILIVSVTAGYGHHATAAAVAEELIQRGVEVRSVDLFKDISTIIYSAVDKGYLLLTKYGPKQFGQFYKMMEKNEKFRKSVITVITSELLANKFVNNIQDFQPDVVVCTHVLANQIIDETTKRGAFAGLHFGIVTDYTFHPFWEDVETINYLVTASELMEYQARRRGINVQKLLPLGIPISKRHLTRRGKAEARTELGLDADKMTLLVMAGSMGHGDMGKIIQDLDVSGIDMQILCVCGNNAKLYAQMAAMRFRLPIQLHGFTDKVDLMMDAADCIVTKPGGLTVSEALAKNLPMILVNPIPGQEQHNSDFLLNNGAAMRVFSGFSIDEAVYMLFHSPNRLEHMREGIAAIRKEDPTGALCSFILEGKGTLSAEGQ